MPGTKGFAMFRELPPAITAIPAVQTNVPPGAAGNHLLALLPAPDRERLLLACEDAPLVPSQVLCEPGQPSRHVWFPEHGFISLVTLAQGCAGLEVGMVGREGMLGVELALGVANVPLRALVQGAGMARRLDAAVFRVQLGRSSALQRVLLRYVHVVMQQMAQSAICLRYHQIGPRLARWLLMSHDRAHADAFHVTQEFLATMLGVRRVGITAAAGALQTRGLIHYHRGEMAVTNRAGLEAAACSCYASQQQTYAAQLG